MPIGDWFDVPGAGTEGQRFIHDLILQQTGDEYAQYWFNEAILNPDRSKEERIELRHELADYLWDEYGFDFEEDFDWEDFRDAYEAA